MVKGYRVLGERNVAGEDAAAARRRIDDALGVVLKGCQKMLDNLYRDDVLDITTDIDVLEQMLRRDGLTESELEKAAAPGPRGRAYRRGGHPVWRGNAHRRRPLERPLRRTPRTRRSRRRRGVRMRRQKAQAVPAPQRQADSGVKRQVEGALRDARSHMPQVPTMSGEMFPSYFNQGEATAQAKKPDEQ